MLTGKIHGPIKDIVISKSNDSDRSCGPPGSWSGYATRVLPGGRMDIEGGRVWDENQPRRSHLRVEEPRKDTTVSVSEKLITSY